LEGEAADKVVHSVEENREKHAFHQTIKLYTGPLKMSLLTARKEPEKPVLWERLLTSDELNQCTTLLSGVQLYCPV